MYGVSGRGRCVYGVSGWGRCVYGVSGWGRVCGVIATIIKLNWNSTECNSYVAP